MAARHSASIAVLTAELSDSYQASVWKGLAEEASGRSQSLVCFLGSRVESPIAREAAANSVYDMANAENFSGLIIISSAISTYLDPKQVQYLFDAHENLPKISIGVSVQGAGAITVESRAAMMALTEHLIVAHGRRRFGIVAGPKWHVESEERRIAILDTLAEHGLPFREGNLVHGSFEQESGKVSVALLLDQRADLDALICLNDRMALGAMEEIKRRGLRVPEDISVVGFDGIEESEFCSPPLTTVLQPLAELGSESVRELSLLIDGGQPRNRRLGCRPVFRQSCGCPPLGTIPQDPLPQLPIRVKDHLRQRHARLTALAMSQNEGEFLAELNRGLEDPTLSADDLGRWSRFLLDLRGLLLETGGLPQYQTVKAWSETLDLAHILVGDVQRRRQGALRVERGRRNNVAREVGISLSEAFEIPELLQRLAEGLERIGIGEAFLVLYERDQGDQARVLFSYGLDEDPGNPLGQLRFSRKTFLPGPLLDAAASRSWMLIPLVFQNKAIGHLLLPGDFPDTEIYETLSKQIASSLTGALLMEQVRSHEQSLEEEVKRRTEELIRTNAALRAEVKTRIRLEQEVVEISKQTMERIGRDLHDDLCQHLAGISLHVTALQSTLDPENAQQKSKVGLVNELLRDSIERAKSIVRGLLPPGLKEDGLIAALKLMVDNTSRTAGLPISFRANGAWKSIQGDLALELFRIIQEAVNNAIKHARAKNIWVSLTKREGRLVAEIRDDGAGMDPKESSDGMGLKIMRYRAEKSGADFRIESGTGGTTVRCALKNGGKE